MLKAFIIVSVATLLSLGAYYGLSKSSLTNSIASNLDLKDYAYVKDFEVKVSAFNDWINKYDKKYSIMELPMKFKVWSDNYDIVEEHNAKNLSWTLETNSFADLTREEHAVLNLGFDQSKMKDFELNIEELEVKPAHKNSVDWRKKGAVSSVKNQQQCGGCWAFAAAAALEGLQKIKNKGTVKNLSAQQLIDCSGSYGNQGCGGGTMVASYQYTQAKGIELDTTYPFIGKQGSCRYSSSKVDFTNKGYKSVPNDYKQLMAAVYLQPVTVAVEADQSAFQMYKSGVISSGCGTNLDHAITAVGYTSTYWIVKNQWGTSWGNQGYVYIAKNSDNVCGINSMASYPTY